jgi:hypothetical protein
VRQHRLRRIDVQEGADSRQRHGGNVGAQARPPEGRRIRPSSGPHRRDSALAVIPHCESGYT